MCKANKKEVDRFNAELIVEAARHIIDPGAGTRNI